MEEKKPSKAKRAALATWKYIKTAKVELIVLFSLLFVDLFSKRMVQTFMREGQTVTLIPRFLQFNFMFNTGGAGGWTFGIESYAGRRAFFIVTTFLALGGFIYFFIRFRGRHVLARLGLAMIIAGALGNLSDRLFIRNAAGRFGVRDFIHFTFFPFIFNFADVWLVVGVILFAVYLIFLYRPPKPKLVGPIFDKEWRPPEENAIISENSPIGEDVKNE